MESDKLKTREWSRIDPEYPAFQASAWEDEHGNRLIAETQPGPYGDGWRVFYETHKDDSLYGGSVVADVSDSEAARQRAETIATAE